MPLIPAAVAIGMVVWALIYLALAAPPTPAQYGDHRTLADLSGQAAPDGPVDGQTVFTANCAVCHQATGTGLAGVFPPLAGSSWVARDPGLIANIILHGLQGEIEVEGTVYNGAMPSLAQLSDEEIAAVATFVRSSWGNDASPLDAELVRAEREAARRDGPCGGGADLLALEAEITGGAAGGEAGEADEAGEGAPAEGTEAEGAAGEAQGEAPAEEAPAAEGASDEAHEDEPPANEAPANEAPANEAEVPPSP